MFAVERFVWWAVCPACARPVRDACPLASYPHAFRRHVGWPGCRTQL